MGKARHIHSLYYKDQHGDAAFASLTMDAEAAWQGADNASLAEKITVYLMDDNNLDLLLGPSEIVEYAS